MLFKNLTDSLESGKSVKIYMVDHIHPGLIAGYAINPRRVKKRDHINSHVELSPYIAMFRIGTSNFSVANLLAGSVQGTLHDDIYHGLLFQGRSTTTDFFEHKESAMRYLERNFGGRLNLDMEGLNEYFSIAKELRISSLRI